MKPRSLYIHIPFCDHICAYCDFPKVFSSYFDRSLYLDRLLKEIDSFHIEKDSLDTIYIGGGTPSSLTPKETEKLLSGLSGLGKIREFSIECNPESLTEEKLFLYRKYGINRISLGVESSKEDVLKRMGRKHTIQDVLRAVENIQKVGIENFSLDFIYGYPGTTKMDSLEDVSFALSLSPKHLSFYSLQIEDNTLLKNKGTFVDDDELADCYQSILDKLEANGYLRYEISNFAIPGYESRHNITYWRDWEYYGCGMGASGFVDNIRYRNTLSITDYLQGKNTREEEKVSMADRKVEYLMLNLRLREGFSLKEYESLFQEDFLQSHEKALRRIEGTYQVEEGRFFLKRDSFFIMDSLLLELI